MWTAADGFGLVPPILKRKVYCHGSLIILGLERCSGREGLKKRMLKYNTTTHVTADGILHKNLEEVPEQNQNASKAQNERRNIGSQLTERSHAKQKRAEIETP
jgi:hypothetical protein